MTPQRALWTPQEAAPHPSLQAAQFGLREVWPSFTVLCSALPQGGHLPPQSCLLVPEHVTPLCFCPYCSHLLPCPATLLSLENSDSSFKPLLKGCLCRGLPDPPRQKRSLPLLPRVPSHRKRPAPALRARRDQVVG